MKVQFLGTGAGLPSKIRNTQSIVFNFMDELKECWMFDCSESTQHQILKTNIKPSKINRIFISHFHGDHILGLIGFLSSRSFLLNEKNKDLYIYGPKGIKEYVKFNLNAICSVINYDIHFIELNHDIILFENEKVIVSSYKLEHKPICYGYKIKFKNQKGSLNVDKLLELGIKSGPFFKEIKDNDNFIFNNKFYKTSDFLGEEKKGKTIFIISDTVYFEEINNYLVDTNILISECTYLKENEEEIAKKHLHLNINNIKEISLKNKIEKIFLTHISSRYTKEDILKIENNNNFKIVNDLEEYIL